MVWLIVLVAVCGYSMANKKPTHPVYYPRGEALSVDGALIGAHLGEPGPPAWRSLDDGCRALVREGCIQALDGRVLRQGDRILAQAGSSRQEVERVLGPEAERPYWRPRQSRFYLFGRLEVEYADDRAVRIRLYTDQALEFLAQNP